jgi:putative SOS response-associated peptidase YedK
MCGRYALHSKPEVIALEFGLQLVPDFAPRYNIAPDAVVPVISNAGVLMAHWRFKRKTHNARLDSLPEKSLFRGAQRCLMPANGFFEWQRRSTGSQPYYVHPAAGALFAFGGIRDADTCAVVTTEANRAMAHIHDRMPLIVLRQDYENWLAGRDVQAMENLVSFPVSDAVNSAANDSPALLRPVEPRGRDLFD